MGLPMTYGEARIFNGIGDAPLVSAKGNLLGQCPISVPITLVTGFYKHLQVT